MTFDDFMSMYNNDPNVQKLVTGTPSQDEITIGQSVTDIQGDGEEAGDAKVDQMAQTAARALQAGPQSYESLRQDLSASLSRRMDLNSVDVSMAARQQDSLTVNVQAQVPSRFLPQLVPAYQIERSATACRLQNIQIDGAQC